jgi:hypothetical protein
MSGLERYISQWNLVDLSELDIWIFIKFSLNFHQFFEKKNRRIFFI